MSIQVKVMPSRKEKGSGTTSFVSWENRDFEKGLNLMFGVMEGERISQVEIDGNGITARFERVEIEKESSNVE